MAQLPQRRMMTSEVRPRAPQPRTTKEKGYSGRWVEVSKRWRANNPLCAECERNGRAVSSQCVDHIVPHRGNQRLFWDSDNWQALCFRCHNIKSANEKQSKNETRIESE